MKYPIAVTMTLALLVPPVAQGQEEKPPPGLSKKDAPKNDDWKFGGMVDGRLGFGMIEEDWFLSVNVGTAFQWGKLGLGVQVPLRFRVIDKDPEDDGVIREEDWDEVSDWTRVVRYISWGKPKDWIYARIGVLSGTTLGHGTLVDRYYNVIDADHYQTGIQFHLDMEYAGGTFFLDNLIDPELFGVRGYVRPLKWIDTHKIFQKLVVGTTLVMDAVAPLSPILDANQKFRTINDDGDLEVTSSQMVLFGFDIGWEVLSTSWVALEPYMDVNVLGQTGGAGFHLGLLSTFDIAGAVTIGTRVEYRAMDADYAPSYVNSFYEIERNDFLGGEPKLNYFLGIDERGEDSTVHGWHVSMDINILKAVTISALLEDYQGPDNANLLIRLLLPYIAGVKLNVYYAKRNFDSASEAFDLDRGLLVAEAKYKFWGPMFAFARYSREWKINKDEAERTGDPKTSKYGRYETINDFDFGIGAEFTF